MSRLLFIAAEPRECLPFISRWERSQRAELHLPVHWARSGVWKGREVLAIANGAGSVRSYAAVKAAAVKAAAPVSAICNIGFCGALEQGLSPGDIFVADSVVSHCGTWPALTPGAKAPASGKLLSSDRIAQTAAEKAALAASGARVVEMEAAGVAAASEHLGVPFYCVRAVSDTAGEDFANDFNRCLRPDGRFNVARLILGALENPGPRFGELIRLSRRTSLAAKNLGEFLADCSF